MSDAETSAAHCGTHSITARWPTVPRSVFAKLAVIMVTMAASLLLLVGLFFRFVIGPNLHTSIDRVWEDYARSLARGALDFARAQELSARLAVQVRYSGPDGNWTTSRYLPSAEEVQQSKVANGDSLLRFNYLVVPAPRGGAYLFAWRLTSRADELHSALLVLLLIVMAAVVVTTYFVLKRLLAPLRALNDGVTRLGTGELDVELPQATRDEFGRLTEAFNQMAHRVRAMIGARDQLLLDVSHELRSPLTRMKVALELMPPGPQREGMADDVAEMEQMVTELMELERLRSGRGLQIAPHDLRPLLDDAAHAFEMQHPGVRVATAPSELQAKFDPEKIRIVLRNLLENAAKYSLPQSRPVEISAAPVGDRIEIRVKDDGPGIPAGTVDRVFEPFYRGDPSRSKNTGGYGLGLSICKRIMQAHDGDIVIELSASHGTTFLLTLPR